MTCRLFHAESISKQMRAYYWLNQWEKNFSESDIWIKYNDFIQGNAFENTVY